MQEQGQVQEQAQTALRTAQEQPAPSRDSADIYADNITEEMLGAMLDGDKAVGDAAAGEQDAEQEQSDTLKPEAQPAPEEKPAEQPPEAPESFELELFGQPAKLSGDQLIELAEAGAQFMHHRPQVEQAMTLMNAVRSDPQLQAILQAYSNGQPLPQVGQPQQPVQPLQVDPNDPLGSVEARLAARLAPQLRQQLIEELQQHYKPFVDNVNAFAAEHRREKAFNKYAADADYQAVNDLMQHNIQAKVRAGEITYEQAARIDAALKADPELYGDWFGRFKAVVKSSRQRPQGGAAGTPQSAGTVKTVHRAPRLEGAAVQGDESHEKHKQMLSRALSGDDAALGALL